MGLVKIWDKEIKGKVYAVGDIHGCYNLLMSNLKKLGFDFENDLLVAVGDLGAIASMDTQLEKSITSVIVFGEKSKGDFDFVQNYLAKIMIANALSDKRREPEGIQLNYLAVLIARMVIDFSIDPELENNFTAQGRLYYAGIRTHQMSVDQYRKTWKQYENMMVIALEVSIKNAGEAIHKYRKESYKG